MTQLSVRTYLKKRILVQDVGGIGFQTAGIRRYVEDLKPDPNTQIGPKGFFEIGSRFIQTCLTISYSLPQATRIGRNPAARKET